MKKEIFIEVGKQLTLKAYVPIASRTMSLIAEAAKDIDEIDETFSVTDISSLLNKMSVHIQGEFAIRRTPSCYCQIVYEPYVFNESTFDEEHISVDIIDTHNDGQECLWVNEKVLFAFVNRELYGIAFMLYFYLGHLMTRDAAFGVSHNISFEKIVESCNEFPEAWRVKHPTTLMRAIADLQDAGLIKWHAKPGTFELLHITPYDPVQKV